MSLLLASEKKYQLFKQSSSKVESRKTKQKKNHWNRSSESTMFLLFQETKERQPNGFEFL